MRKKKSKSDQIKLIRFRKEMGWTQTELAEKFRVVPSCVSHWESGVRSIPGPVMVLIKILRGKPNFLL